MMLDLNRSKEMVVFCAIEKCIFDNKHLNTFYKNTFYVCDSYVKILESLQQGRVVFTLYLRCYPQGENEYIDLFIQDCGLASRGLYVNSNGTRRIKNFVVWLLQYINNNDVDIPFAKRLACIRTFWLNEGYYFHESVFKFIVTLCISHPVRLQPCTELYNHAKFLGYGREDR